VDAHDTLAGDAGSSTQDPRLDEGELAGLADLLASERRMREEHRTTEAILEAMLDPHVILSPVRDASGTVVDLEYVSANEAARRYMRRDAADMVGRRFTSISHGTAVETVLRWFGRVLDTGESLALDDFRLQRSADAAERWLDIRAVRVGDSVSFTWRDVTEGHRDARLLAERESQYRLLADNATDVILRSDRGGLIEWVSPSVTEVLGWTPEQVVGQQISRLMHPDDLAAVMYRQQEIIDAGGTEGRTTARFATAAGGWRWMSDHGRAILDADASIVGGIDALRDIEAEHIAAEELAEREHRAVVASARAERAERELRGVIDSLLDPWVLLAAVRDEGGEIVDFEYVDANEAACTSNHRSRADLIGQRLLTLLPEHGTSGLFDVYADIVRTGRPLALDDVAFRSPFDGMERRFDNRAVRVGDGISFTWRDVTERYMLRQQLHEQADSDLLTGAANRRKLSRRMTELVGHAPRTGDRLAVLYCDLDHFKDINDEFGHAVGDAVLASVAASIRSAVREQDLVARLGGDEFVVLLDGVRGLDDAMAVAQKILGAVHREVRTGTATIHPEASIGVAVVEAGEDEDAVMARADVALYEAKRAGRDRARAAVTATVPDRH
jgi:diguanylate cyclase (GGDEF)-like protein/PAS domain S-box-containing protein